MLVRNISYKGEKLLFFQGCYSTKKKKTNQKQSLDKHTSVHGQSTYSFQEPYARIKAWLSASHHEIQFNIPPKCVPLPL